MKLVKLYPPVLIYASLVFHVLFPDQLRVLYHSVCLLIALTECSVEGHIGRPICVVAQCTLQASVAFAGYFPIEFSRKIRYGLNIARIHMSGLKLFLKKEFMERRKLQNICLIYLYSPIVIK